MLRFAIWAGVTLALVSTTGWGIGRVRHARRRRYSSDRRQWWAG